MAKKRSRIRQNVTVGPNKRVTVYAKTKKELKQKVARLLAEVDAGTHIEPNRATIADLANEWPAWYFRRRNIKESTQEMYQGVLDAHIVPLFGKLIVQDITEQTVFTKMDERKHLSISRQRKIMLTLRLLLKYAIRRGIIASDPTADIQLAEQRNEQNRDMMCLNQEQAAEFLRVCGDFKLGGLFTILLTTGMRCGELLALHVSDILDDCQTLRIHRTITDTKNGPAVSDSPKTASGRRTIPVPQIAREAILDRMAFRMKHKAKGELLFGSETGTPMRRNNLMRRYFRPILKVARLTEAITIHDLRHSYATLTLNAGVPVHVVSQMLGHRSVSITLDLYTHALPNNKRAAADAAQLLFSGGQQSEKWGPSGVHLPPG